MKPQILLLVSFFVLVQCTIEKRRYTKGLYISLNKSSFNENRTENFNEIKKSVLLNKSQKIRTSDTEIIKPVSTTKKDRIEAPQKESNNCDLIILNSGVEVEVKIIQETDALIRYQRCPNVSGPIFKVRKSSVKKIIYKADRSTTNEKSKATSNNNCDVIKMNSGVEVEVTIIEETDELIRYQRCPENSGPIFKVTKSSVDKIIHKSEHKIDVEHADNNEYFDENVIINESQKETAEINTKEEVESGKKLIVAIILCVFLGFLGLHRFYLDYPVLGILYLLTGGLFFIGWIIDIILLITGSLKPKKIKKYDDEEDFFGSES